MTNRNAIAGKNIETLFCNSVGDNDSVIQKIQASFGISARYLNSMKTGIHGEKCDVKMSFADGRNIDANVKAYKPKTMFNQTTRTSLTRFQEVMGISQDDIDELRGLFLLKAQDSNRPLIPMSLRNKWAYIIEERAKKIVKWSLSSHESREILVLYDRVESKMRIYRMSDVLHGISSAVTFTPKGNIIIGACIQLQRKGGDGNVTRVPKDNPTHPSNHIQVKLDIRTFLDLGFPLLAQYSI